MSETINLLRTHEGHKTWKLNLRTQEISEVENKKFRGVLVSHEGETDHWYCSALNKKNAFKQFNKKAQSIIVGKNPPPHDRAIHNR
jgi:hypothetical protein